MRKTCLLMFALAACTMAGAAIAKSSVPAWSLIPEPAVTHPATHGAVTVTDGDHVRVKSHGNQQAVSIVRRFITLVASTRGLHLSLDATSKDRMHDRIVFDLDRPRTSRARRAIASTSATTGSASPHARRADCSTAASPPGNF